MQQCRGIWVYIATAYKKMMVSGPLIIFKFSIWSTLLSSMTYTNISATNFSEPSLFAKLKLHINKSWILSFALSLSP